MAVHRVGRTLLLDELDIQELFMRSSQVQEGSLETLSIVPMIVCFVYVL